MNLRYVYKSMKRKKHEKRKIWIKWKEKEKMVTWKKRVVYFIAMVCVFCIILSLFTVPDFGKEIFNANLFTR